MILLRPSQKGHSPEETNPPRYAYPVDGAHVQPASTGHDDVIDAEIIEDESVEAETGCHLSQVLLIFGLCSMTTSMKPHSNLSNPLHRIGPIISGLKCGLFLTSLRKKWLFWLAVSSFFWDGDRTSFESNCFDMRVPRCAFTLLKSLVSSQVPPCFPQFRFLRNDPVPEVSVAANQCYQRLKSR